MPRARINFSKKKSASSGGSGFKYFVFICLLLIAQNLFLLYRNYDKVSVYVTNFFATDSTEINSAKASLFADDALSESEMSTTSTKIMTNNDKKSEPAFDYSQNSIQTGKVVKVSILNGCGVNGLAGKWKTILRDLNYDVRETDNSREKYQSSVIICRTDDKNVAYQMANKLGIDKKNIILQKNKNIVDIDLTLVLGKDHTRLKVK